MRENGPEPIIVQIKNELRTSETFDDDLAKLAAMQKRAGITVTRRWIGAKHLELLSFPESFSREQALEVIATLQREPAIQKVATASAANLVFQSSDFEREFGPKENVPEVAKRGFDTDRLRRRHKGPDHDAAVTVPHVPNQLIVRIKDEFVWRAAKTGFSRQLSEFHAQNGCRVVSEVKHTETYLAQVLEFDRERAPLIAQLRRYHAAPWVDYAEPNYLLKPAVVPNDQHYGSGSVGQWNMRKIQAEAAWNFSQGHTPSGYNPFVLAIADSGADIGNPDISPNFAYRHNFLNNTNDVADHSFYSHGSVVTGVAGARGNNGVMMAGTSWFSKLGILKIMTGDSGPNYVDMVRAIDYARGNAIAINCSFQSSPYDWSAQTGEPNYNYLNEAALRAKGDNLLIVTAAGNDNINVDDPGNDIIPGSLSADSILNVGGTDRNDQRAYWFQGSAIASNFGPYKVDIGAPAIDVLGLYKNSSNTYQFLYGTSVAAPHVTGAAGLIKSIYPWEGYFGLRDRILMSADEFPHLAPFGWEGGFRTGGRLNLRKALHKRTLISNLSTRALVRDNGDGAIIGGFIVAGDEQMTVAIRGIGPTLQPQLGVPALDDPQIILNDSAGNTIRFNDDWNNLPQQEKDALWNSGIAPADGREAAMVVTLQGGKAYTLFVQSQNGWQFGVGQFEIYELSGHTNQRTRLANVSTRCFVGTGDHAAIAGTIIGDPGSAYDPFAPRRRVLARGLGEELYSRGINDFLPDPQLKFFSGGTLLSENDWWRDVDGGYRGLEDELATNGFAPRFDHESVIWPTLARGYYTTVLTDTYGRSGIALLEYYEY